MHYLVSTVQQRQGHNERIHECDSKTRASPHKRLKEPVQLGMEKRGLRDLISDYEYLEGRCREDTGRFFSVCPLSGEEAMGMK